MLDSKAVLTNLQIERERLNLLAQLLAERYGEPTRPDIQDKTE